MTRRRSPQFGRRPPTLDIKEEHPTMSWANKATAETLNGFVRETHRANETWWHDPKTGLWMQRNKGELLMLIVSEIAECMEAERTRAMDQHLPKRPGAEVELADALIRIFDYAGAHAYDLGGAFVDKLKYNAERLDHKPDERLKEGGKQW